jgi:hypothetical protein
MEHTDDDLLIGWVGDLQDVPLTFTGKWLKMTMNQVTVVLEKMIELVEKPAILSFAHMTTVDCGKISLQLLDWSASRECFKKPSI